MAELRDIIRHAPSRSARLTLFDWTILLFPTALAEPALNRQATIQRLPVARTARGLSIGAFDVVEYWETPIQETLASEAVQHGRRIFEVGYGLGICARKIASLKPDAHTIV